MLHDPGISVLIADDDPRVRRGLRALIETDPTFRIVGEAASAREVEAALPLAPAVILLDLLLPTACDGMGMLRALVREPGCTVIAMSARGGLREKALHAGARLFLDKGSSPDAILDALHAVSR